MRRLGSLLSLVGLAVVSCLVPDLELVDELPGAGGDASAAGGSSAAAAGKGSTTKGGSSANAGTQNGDAGMAAGGASATGGGAPPVGDAGAGAGGDGTMILDDSAPSCAALSKMACRGESCCATLPAPGCTGCDASGGKYTTDSAALESAMEFRPCKLLSVRTWTKEPGENEQKPANCLTWYEAFAFCAWDGGFLPTELDWQAAASGGAENRMYAWAGATLDIDHALYGACGNGVSATCDLSSILEVGSKPAGAGKYGHLDLTGSVWEWLLDSPDSELPTTLPCNDCASLGVSNYRSIRGGSWPEDASYMPVARRVEDPADSSWYNVGIRCAHAP